MSSWKNNNHIPRVKQRLLLALLLFFSSSLLLAEGVDQRKERLEEIRTQIKKKQERLEQALAESASHDR